MRVGLFGGSFNPAHAGHAHVAQTALSRLDLDLVIWLVAAGNPLKPRPGRTSERAASAASRARGAMVVSDAERRMGTRFTLDTVRRLERRFPKVHFVWIMGADSLADLHHWRGWQELMAEIPVAVVARPGDSLRALTSPAARRFAHARLPGGAGRRLVRSRPPAWIYLTGPWNYASSTALRIASGRQDLAGRT
jgi:nicotinate-nucleotide adenylyltransferase